MRPTEPDLLGMRVLTRTVLSLVLGRSFFKGRRRKSSSSMSIFRKKLHSALIQCQCMAKEAYVVHAVCRTFM